MKIIFRNPIHVNSKSHDCIFAEIKGKKVKLTYQAYNAAEKFNVELFDGDKWNHFLSMVDMGIVPDSNNYVSDGAKRKKRADDLFKKAEEICNKRL